MKLLKIFALSHRSSAEPLSVWSGRCGNDNSVMAALLMSCSSEEIFCETRRGPHHNPRLLTWLPVVPLQWRPFGPWHLLPLVLSVVESKELVFAHHLDLHPSGTFVTSAFKCPSSTVVSSKGFSTILNYSYLPRFLCNRFSPSLKSIFSFPLTFSYIVRRGPCTPKQTILPSPSELVFTLLFSIRSVICSFQRLFPSRALSLINEVDTFIILFAFNGFRCTSRLSLATPSTSWNMTGPTPSTPAIW